MEIILGLLCLTVVFVCVAMSRERPIWVGGAMLWLALRPLLGVAIMSAAWNGLLLPPKDWPRARWPLCMRLPGTSLVLAPAAHYRTGKISEGNFWLVSVALMFFLLAVIGL